MTVKSLSNAATDAATKFAFDTFGRVPKDNKEAFEAHVTAVLILFLGALRGTFGSDHARDFIEEQLRGMEPDQSSVVFTPPRIQ